MIIDCHAHVACQTVLPSPFLSGWAKNIAATLPSSARFEERSIQLLLKRILDDPWCDGLVAQMNEAGIDRSVLLIIDFKFAYGEEATELGEVFLRHKKILERHPDRFVVFAGVDPRRGRAGVELFESSLKEYGFSGLKLYPPCGFSPSDPRLFDYYDVCRAHGVPVLTHVGPTSPSLAFRYSVPYGVDEAAQSFPEVRFILGHAGSTSLEESAELAAYRPNVFLDLSGFQTFEIRGDLARLVGWHREKGTIAKLLFGSDWPIHRLQGSQARWVQAFERLKEQGDMTEEEHRRIMSENWLRIGAERQGA